MKRNITISSVFAMLRLSMSMVETRSGMKAVAQFERCLRIWTRDGFTHPNLPVGYDPLPRSGWHQFQNCLAPN